MDFDHHMLNMNCIGSIYENDLSVVLLILVKRERGDDEIMDCLNIFTVRRRTLRVEMEWDDKKNAVHIINLTTVNKKHVLLHTAVNTSISNLEIFPMHCITFQLKFLRCFQEKSRCDAQS